MGNKTMGNKTMGNKTMGNKTMGKRLAVGRSGLDGAVSDGDLRSAARDEHAWVPGITHHSAAVALHRREAQTAGLCDSIFISARQRPER